MGDDNVFLFKVELHFLIKTCLFLCFKNALIFFIFLKKKFYSN